jgi:hypothetical protein
MKIFSFASIILVALFSAAGCKKPVPVPSADDRTLLTIINASKKCEDTNTGIECNYRVGDFFKISIADIGTESSGIHFEKSNSDKPIYASFGILHGCVIVNRFEGAKGMPEWVFISPKNGNVYNSWLECKAGT